MFVVLGAITNVNDNMGTSSTSYSLIDTFEDDTVATDPNGNDSNGIPYTVFYEYTENNWNVTDDVTNATDMQFDGTRGMRYAGNNIGPDGTYHFLGEDGNEFCGRTDISEITWALNFEMNDTTHEGADYTLYDCDDGIIVWLTVTDEYATLYTTGPTELMNISISNMTWYRVVVTIDYSGGMPMVQCNFYTLDLAGFFTVEADDNYTAVECSKLSYMVVDPARAGFVVDTAFDDLEIDFTVDTSTTTNLGGLSDAWILVIGFIILAIIVGVLFMTITEMKKKK